MKKWIYLKNLFSSRLLNAEPRKTFQKGAATKSWPWLLGSHFFIVGPIELIFWYVGANVLVREGFKKKYVKFGLLAEIRRGRGLKGVHEPNLLSGIFKNDLIAPKHEIKHKKIL